QNFNTSPNSSYRFWLNQKTGAGALVQTGADGVLTIPAVPGGSLLIVEPDGTTPLLENPTPSLTINGSGQPAQVTAGDAFQLSASMDAGDHEGENADWWIVYAGGDAPYSLTAQGWVPVLDNILTLPLLDFSSVSIPPPTLQPGAYTFYFAVDLVPDGQLSMSSLFYDAAAITVSPPDAPDNGPADDPTDGPTTRIAPGDLVYRGAFAFPAGEGWTISGHAMTYYPGGDPNGANDGHPGSLYAAGSELQDLVGEISIPSPSMSRNFDDLPKATVLRPLTDITGGLKDTCTFAPGCLYREVDGLAYLPDADKIAWNLREWYGVEGYDMDSLGWSELDLTAPRGIWHIGSREDGAFHYQKTCDYLFTAPESFAETWLEGKRLIAGNQNEAGANGGSQGPSFIALAPWEDGDPPAPGQALDALALVYYPEIYECVWEDPAVCHLPGYRAVDNWGGAVWAFTSEQSAILVTGRKGLGDNCYGEYTDCNNDPCSTSRGYHAWPYETQILFYDPMEITNVVGGSAQPWDVLPYATHTPSSEVFNPSCGVLGAAAYNDENRMLYIAEKVGGPDA
ncbi:MAG: hypothetical protein GY859_10960, partial [Desulfobacterales bacterium]|nr:hypothetical protein [Desulfobacterales bacterium]